MSLAALPGDLLDRAASTLGTVRAWGLLAGRFSKDASVSQTVDRRHHTSVVVDKRLSWIQSDAPVKLGWGRLVRDAHLQKTSKLRSDARSVSATSFIRFLSAKLPSTASLR